MTSRKVDLIVNAINCPVVQIEGRSYPGVVIQGDSLFSMYKQAEKLLSSVNTDDSGYDAAEFLCDSLKGYLDAYEDALDKKSIELPYVKA